ncbi:MAG: LysR family transcriptional regulator [Rhizobiales bacterium]|nr:LysR family transcriptional regulator [Hyphomicrobiales bacterium]
MKHLQTFRLIVSVARAGSIRKAAEDMNITASALNRRILRFEEDFGSEIFERLPRGVRPNAAGELVLQHIRGQISDLERVQSQVADLSGIRRGHVSIACSQALLPYFLPSQIAQYRRDHPGVTFSVNVRDRVQSEQDLANFSSDLALVYEPVHMVDFDILHQISQPVCAVVKNDHPLLDKDVLRLRDCLNYPNVLPSAQYGVRNLLEAATRNISMPLFPILETDSFDLIRHYVLHESAVGYQIPIGLQGSQTEFLQYRKLPERDIPAGRLLLGQMRGRSLPVASAQFATQLINSLIEFE